MEPPECVWDADLGLVLLCRDAAAGMAQRDLSLVVAPDDAPAWYAGDFPADWPRWAIKAPSAGSFQLLGYPRGALPASAGRPDPAAAVPPEPGSVALGDPSSDLASELPGDPSNDSLPGQAGALPDGRLFELRFCHALGLDPRRPASPGHPIRAWLFHPPARTGQAPAVQPLSVPPDCSLGAALDLWGWRPDGPIGLAAQREQAPPPGAAFATRRGPLTTPLQAATIDCIFTLVPDTQAPELALPGFEQLQAPALALDLSAFGAAAETVRAAFWCFHHPHGPGRDIRHWLGHELPLVDAGQGRQLLVCRFDDACHLDHFGCYFAGGPRLYARDDAEPDLPPTVALQGLGTGDGSACLVARFHGDTCQLLPALASRYAAVAREYCSVADPGGFSLPRAAAWLAADPALRAVPHSDWQGAGAASAFTLLAYADWLTRLFATPAAAVRRQAQAQGLGSFAGFVRRPDLALALLAEPALAARLATSPPRPGTLLDPSQLAPVAALAAALEPHANGLGAWVAAAPPVVQQALWSFLLAGGQASHWRALALRPQDLPADLAALAARLRQAFAELPGWISATRADLGQPPLPDLPLTRLADAEARAAAPAAAAAAIRAEYDRLAALLPEAAGSSCEALITAFDTALAAGKVATGEVLQRRLQAALATGDPRHQRLAQLIGDLRTRAVLWGLETWRQMRSGVAPAVAPANSTAAPPAPTDAAPSPPALVELTTASAHPPASVPVSAPVSTQAPASASDPPAPPVSDPRASAPIDVSSSRSDLARLEHWCDRVLALAAPDWPPPGTANPPLDAAQRTARLAKLYAFWGLDRGHALPLPGWTGARAAAHARHAAAIAANGGQVRQAARAAGAMDLLPVVERLVAAREQLAAASVHAGLRTEIDVLAATAAPARAAALADLGRQLRRSGPERWEALAAAADALVAPDPITDENRER